MKHDSQSKLEPWSLLMKPSLFFRNYGATCISRNINYHKMRQCHIKLPKAFVYFHLNIRLTRFSKILKLALFPKSVFKNLFLSLAEFLLTKLPNAPDKYKSESNINHFSSFTITDFCLNNTPEDKVFEIILQIETFKAAELDRLSRPYLWDGAEVLSRPISKLCELIIFGGFLWNACKVAKVKSIYKKQKKAHPFVKTYFFTFDNF